jgi:protein TonB
LDPDEPYWYSALAKLSHAPGDSEEATKECAEAAQLSPDDSRLAEGCGFGPKQDNRRDDGLGLGPIVPPTSQKTGPRPNVSAPVPISKPEPSYADKARDARLQGVVVLWFTVNTQGDVEKAAVVKPLGLGLDQSALRTVRTWKFEPATKDGSPVAVGVMVEVRFRLF